MLRNTEARLRSLGQTLRFRQVRVAIDIAEEIHCLADGFSRDLMRQKLPPFDVFIHGQVVMPVASERSREGAQTVAPSESREGEFGAQAITRIIGMLEISLEQRRPAAGVDAIDAVIAATAQRLNGMRAGESRSGEQLGNRCLQTGSNHVRRLVP